MARDDHASVAVAQDRSFALVSVPRVVPVFLGKTHAEPLPQQPHIPEVAVAWLIAGVTQHLGLRRHELCQTVIRNWRQQYAQGRLADPEGVGESQEQRIRELERMVGQLTMENALLKRAVAYTLQRRREASLPVTGPSSARSAGGVS